jgi:hypothetical protein
MRKPNNEPLDMLQETLAITNILSPNQEEAS